jgi:metallophosphoesterase (TIGR00282 family)
MKILFVGDIVGACGRGIFFDSLPSLKREHALDMVIVNGENAAHGKGITLNISEELFEAGVDVITMGNHVWNNKDIFQILEYNSRVIRPANLPADNPGRGSVVCEVGGVKVGVLNLLGQVFMDPCDCPFAAAVREVETLRQETDVIIVDMHAEATSEKMAMGWLLDGCVSAVLGTHTHIQTADEKILPKGTAYITDVGMTGAYYSVLGMDRKMIVDRFVTKLPQKFTLADGGAQLNGVVLDIDEASGKSRSITRLSFTDF